MPCELGRRGVAVNAIVPTAIDRTGIFTDPNGQSEMRKIVSNVCPRGRIGRPEDVANVAEFFFASELSAFVSGQQLLVSGGGLG
jgi:3-oxoacyl-[acyl-carrier protein] reductase